MQPSVAIDIHSLPNAECVELGRRDPAEYFIRHITQECGSYVDLLVNGRNTLGGYTGAYVYPTLMFLQTLNNGLGGALRSGFSSIPIYLQQYSFDDDSPHHCLEVSIDDRDRSMATVTFLWCDCTSEPEHLPVVRGERVLVNDFVEQVRRNLVRFKDAIAALLPLFGPSISVSLPELFADFLDVEGMKCD
jgi:hypothetical protein